MATFIRQLLFLLIAGLVFHLYAQEKLTVEWLYSSQYDSIAAMPRVQWLANNQLLLLDGRTPQTDRTFETIEPGKWLRNAMINPAPALQSLNNLRSGKDTVKVLKWPDALSSNANKMAYVYDDDLFILDAKSGLFSRLTNGTEIEKSPNFSPDEKKLAFVRDNDLYVYHFETGKETRLTSTGSETFLNGTLSWVYWEEIFGRRDIGYWWSHDSKSIAFLQTDESAVAKMYYVNNRTVEPELIVQRYPKAGMENPTVHVGVVGAMGGEEPIWLELGDYEYIARVKWLPNDKNIAVQTLNRPQTALSLFYADPKTGKSQAVMTERDTAWVNINDDLYFLDNNKAFFWQSERDGYAHLYRFDMNGKLRNPVTRGNWAMRASGGAFWLRQSVMAIDQKEKQIYFTSMKESSIQRHLYRVNFDGSRLTKITRDDGVHRIAFSPNAKYYVDRYSNSRTMPSSAIYDNSGKLVMMLAPPRNAAIKDFELQFPQLTTIPTRDGFPMPAEILKPANFDPMKKYPVIYYIYGGPSAPTVFDAWRGQSLLFDNILLQRGYVVVRFDHRSSTAISKILENRLNKMMSGPREMEDVKDGIQWLKSQTWVDPERVGIWGWSGGGSFTINAMTNTKEFKAGFAVAAVTDWHYYDTRWAEFGMKTPQENPEGYRRTSFIQSAKNLHGRLMLVHGTYDDNVHPQNAWNFVDELVKHNIPFEMMMYPMRKHGIRDKPARIHLYNTMLDFWKRNL